MNHSRNEFRSIARPVLRDLKQRHLTRLAMILRLIASFEFSVGTPGGSERIRMRRRFFQ